MDFSEFFDGNVTTFHLREVETNKGVLIPVELQKLRLNPVHAFLVKAPSGTTRGGHGHKIGRQILIRVSGEIEVELFWNNQDMSVTLDSQNNAILITSPVWSRQIYRGESPCLLALCDTPYDPSNYIYKRD